MELVILAAGHGRRFGGLKQLEPVGPNSEAIMDYTARDAKACGFSRIVVVVRDEIIDEIRSHVSAHWPSDISVDFVCQPPLPGTAQAVLSARPVISSHFAVVNADDLYGKAALDRCVQHFARGEDGRHLLVAYRLRQTVLTDGEVTRGLCEANAEGELRRIVEHRVVRHEDGSFDATPLVDESASPQPLSGDERVSMNLWGFHTRIFDEIEEALDSYRDTDTSKSEFLLPSVVGNLVTSGTDIVRVDVTDDQCFGITHRHDLELVRAILAGTPVPGRLADASETS